MTTIGSSYIATDMNYRQPIKTIVLVVNALDTRRHQQSRKMTGSWQLRLSTMFAVNG